MFKAHTEVQRVSYRQFLDQRIEHILRSNNTKGEKKEEEEEKEKRIVILLADKMQGVMTREDETRYVGKRALKETQAMSSE